MSNDNSGTWSGLLVNAFLAGTGAASANLLANVAWRDSYGLIAETGAGPCHVHYLSIEPSHEFL